MNLEERIVRLERDNRRWKRITLLVALESMEMLGINGELR